MQAGHTAQYAAFEAHHAPPTTSDVRAVGSAALVPGFTHRAPSRLPVCTRTHARLSSLPLPLPTTFAHGAPLRPSPESVAGTWAPVAWGAWDAVPGKHGRKGAAKAAKGCHSCACHDMGSCLIASIWVRPGDARPPKATHTWPYWLCARPMHACECNKSAQHPGSRTAAVRLPVPLPAPSLQPSTWCAPSAGAQGREDEFPGDRGTCAARSCS